MELYSYVEGSIYSGYKTVTPSWLYEKLATSVDAIKVINDTGNLVSLGWGDTPAIAMVERAVIPIGATKIISVTGDYVAWKGVSGLILLEQSRLI